MSDLTIDAITALVFAASDEEAKSRPDYLLMPVKHQVSPSIRAALALLPPPSVVISSKASPKKKHSHLLIAAAVALASASMMQSPAPITRQTPRRRSPAPLKPGQSSYDPRYKR